MANKIHKGRPGQENAIPSEHQINGTRLTANITGTFNFDWNAFSQFVLTPTGPVTLGNTNLPTGTNSKEIKGIIKAGSAVTKPANWNATADSDAFDNTLDNHFRAWVSAEGVVTFTNKNKAVSGGWSGTENIAAGAFTGVLDVSGGNRYYDDYDSGSALGELSLSINKALGATATVRIKGDLTGTIPITWNFSGQSITPDPIKLNELSLLYVKPNDIRIVNRVVFLPDSDAPTAPTNLASPSQNHEAISLTWDASTDNVGVTGYNIYKDGVLEKTVSTLSTTVTGLLESTSYTFTVKGFDFAGNESDASNSLTVSTIAFSPASPANISALELWFDGTDESTMTVDVDNKITAFTSKVNGYSFTKDAASAPLFNGSEIVFGTNQSFARAAIALLSPANDFHGFIIVKSTTADSTTFFNNTSASLSRVAVGTNTGTLSWWTYDPHQALNTAFTDTENYHKIEFKNKAGVLTMYLDGVQITFTGSKYPTSNPNLFFSIGGHTNGSGQPQIFKDMFVKAGEMTELERTEALEYIQIKHNL